MDPDKLPQVPRALRASFLPHRTMENIEKCLDRCAKRAKTAEEKKIHVWTQDPSGDFTAADDARLAAAMDAYRGDFAVIARVHFPHRSQFQVRHRAAKLSSC